MERLCICHDARLDYLRCHCCFVSALACRSGRHARWTATLRVVIRWRTGWPVSAVPTGFALSNPVATVQTTSAIYPPDFCIFCIIWSVWRNQKSRVTDRIGVAAKKCHPAKVLGGEPVGRVGNQPAHLPKLATSYNYRQNTQNNSCTVWSIWRIWIYVQFNRWHVLTFSNNGGL